MFKEAHLRSLLGSILIGSMAAISTPAMATNEAMLDLLKILKDKGSITAEEYELLTNASKADGEKIEGNINEMKAKVDKASKSMPKINAKGKLEIASQDGNYKWRIGGRLQADTTFGGSDVDFGSEAGNPITEFRRARMYLSGEMYKLWKFKLQYDFAHDQGGGATSLNGLRDAYIAYKGFKPVTITLAHHKMPLSMEELTSSKYITFIERSQLVNGIVADVGGGRQYGLSAKGHFNNMFTAAAGIYAGTANEDSSDSQAGFTGRVTFSPIHEKTRMVHLGLGFDKSRDQGGGFNIDGEPEIHPRRDILENDATNHRDSTTWVAEVAGIYGPWAIQAEYASNEISGSPTVADLDSDAWYIYGSYHLTGESRNYRWKKGSYSQTKVKNPLGKGGYGAWELALRYTSGEFDNSVTTVSASDEADILTAGINWHPINNVRLSANYVNILEANLGADAELATDLDNSTTKAEDADYFVLRGQWYF